MKPNLSTQLNFCTEQRLSQDFDKTELKLSRDWAETEPRLSRNHSDLNDQNLFHSTIDAPQGVPGVSKNNQSELHSGELEH